MVEGKQVTVTEVIVGSGFMVTVAVPDFEVSCVEVAVTVTFVVEETVGAVNRPEEEIEPALAVHVTAELRLPVPTTDAEHWLVCPDRMVDGEHVERTELMVEGSLPPPLMPPPLLLPPQAAIHNTFAVTNAKLNLHIIVSSMDFADLNPFWH